MTHYMNIAIPNAQLEGIILGKTSITLENGASITGRALAQTEVNLGRQYYYCSVKHEAV